VKNVLIGAKIVKFRTIKLFALNVNKYMINKYKIIVTHKILVCAKKVSFYKFQQNRVQNVLTGA
jgi:hypothetical protein